MKKETMKVVKRDFDLGILSCRADWECFPSDFYLRCITQAVIHDHEKLSNTKTLITSSDNDSEKQT